jgi:hypothetical protein
LFTGHSDATVRVTAYSTLGGFLVAVAPISPITFYKAFSQAIDHIEEQTISAKLSIAVINMFTYRNCMVYLIIGGQGRTAISRPSEASHFKHDTSVK